jgi:hypothetical protein
MVDNALALTHPTSPTTDADPMDNLPMDIRPMGDLDRRGHLDGCEKITVRRRCIIVIIISRRVGPGASVSACGGGDHFDDPTMRAAHRYVGRARPYIFFVGVSRIDLWRNCARWTMIPRFADQDP